MTAYPRGVVRASIRWRRCGDVRFSVLGVGINFALALGTVVAIGYWRRIERMRAARPPVKGPGR